MVILKKSYKMPLVIFIIITLLLPTILVTTNVLPVTNVKAENEMSADDRRISEEISNMTGVTVEEIIKLKNQGITWNKVLEKMKQTNTNVKNNQNARNIALAQNGLDDDFVKKLKAEGFTDKEITEVNMLVERVVYELEDITTSNTLKEKQIPAVDNNLDAKSDEDTSAYNSLFSKIESKTAIYLLLKLSKDFGTYENVLDEYLLSLQIDASLEKYIIDRDSYNKEKEEKMAGTDKDKIITLAKIEDKMLKVLQNEVPGNNTKTGNENNLPSVSKDNNTDDNSPQLPIPDSNSVKPKNPANDVMNEINDINANILSN